MERQLTLYLPYPEMGQYVRTSTFGLCFFTHAITAINGVVIYATPLPPCSRSASTTVLPCSLHMHCHTHNITAGEVTILGVDSSAFDATCPRSSPSSRSHIEHDIELDFHKILEDQRRRSPREEVTQSRGRIKLKKTLQMFLHYCWFWPRSTLFTTFVDSLRAI